MADPRVVFTPSGLSGSVREGTTVLEAARAIGADLDTVCGGRGICGRCQVEPSIGSFAKWDIVATADSLSAWGPLEQDYKGKRPIAAGQRLGCSAKVLGDVVIDIPPESQIHKQVIRKELDLGDLTIDPVYTLHYIPEGDPVEVLHTEWGLEVDGNGTAADGGDTTVAVRSGTTIAAAWPGYTDRIGGLAFDVGSTTIAGHLVDLATGEVLASAGRMNPQIRFGEDLMSRVSYVMMNPGGDVELTQAVRTAIDELSTELVDQAGLDRSHVVDMTLVGNPVMHHIFLGHDPTPLGQAPFPLATDGAVHTTAETLDLALENATAYVPPCIAGHVGADTAAAIVAEGPHRSETIQLLVDVGTNAEIVLGNGEKLFAASSPTGPAFEGAQISSGQRATAGAIERVRIDRETFEPRFRVIGSPHWSDEAGFDADIEATGISGICGSGIIEVISEMVSAGIIDHQGVILGPEVVPTDRIVADGRTFSYVLQGDIHVTQADVRAIQLAKAALRAGIELLLEHAGLERPDEIRLAGAFGAHIDPAHAMVLGLIPDVELDSVRAVGNAAGSGAVRLLLSQQQRSEIERTVRMVTKIETATEPRFQDLFVEALAFPHSRAAKPTASDGRRRRRTRPVESETRS